LVFAISRRRSATCSSTVEEAARGQAGTRLIALDRGDLIAIGLTSEHRFDGVAV
jgi:hypothetical protein